MVSISTPIAVPLAPPPRVPASAATPVWLRPRPHWRSDSSPRRHCRAGGGAAGVGTCAGWGHGEGGDGAEQHGKVGAAGAGPWGRDPGLKRLLRSLTRLKIIDPLIGENVEGRMQTLAHAPTHPSIHPFNTYLSALGNPRGLTD